MTIERLFITYKIGLIKIIVLPKCYEADKNGPRYLVMNDK